MSQTEVHRHTKPYFFSSLSDDTRKAAVPAHHTLAASSAISFSPAPVDHERFSTGLHDNTCCRHPQVSEQSTQGVVGSMTGKQDSYKEQENKKKLLCNLLQFVLQRWNTNTHVH